MEKRCKSVYNGTTVPIQQCFLNSTVIFLMVGGEFAVFTNSDFPVYFICNKDLKS